MTVKIKILAYSLFVLVSFAVIGFYAWRMKNSIIIPPDIINQPADKNLETPVNITDNRSIDQSRQTVNIQNTDATTSPLSGQTTGPINDQPSSTTTNPAASQPDTKKPLLWGAYVGWQTTDLAEFEKKVGRQVDHQATFVHWGNENEFPQELAQPLKSKNKTLIIFWEATDYNIEGSEQPKFSYDRIIAGDWDAYFKSFALAAKNYGGPVILIPFEEANGDWYPWALTKNNNSAAKHIVAYRYLRSFFTEATNVKFGWTVNADSVPDTDANDWLKAYPGDKYVDYVGVNGFNFGEPWQTFTEIFSTALNRLQNLNKPVYIFSFACAEGPETRDKPDWIREALTKEIYQYPQIAGWNWFNENKEADWRVWSSTSSLENFKQAVNK